MTLPAAECCTATSRHVDGLSRLVTSRHVDGLARLVTSRYVDGPHDMKQGNAVLVIFRAIPAEGWECSAVLCAVLLVLLVVVFSYSISVLFSAGGVCGRGAPNVREH